MKALAHIRRSKGLTQAQLADMAGIDQGTISKIENDKGYNYTAEMLHRLADALGVEPVELFELPELQQRVINALRNIHDPVDQSAALRILESMAKR